MSVTVQRLDEEHVQLEFEPDVGKLLGFLKVVTLLFGVIVTAMMVWFTGRGGCGLLSALVPVGIWFGLRNFASKRRPKLRFDIAVKDRRLRVPGLWGKPPTSYTFPHVGYVVIDAYTLTVKRGNSVGSATGRASARVIRLSFVEREYDAQELEERTHELEQRPSASRHKPVAPGDGDELVASLPYAVARTLSRELGHAFDFPVMDLTSAPPRVFTVDTPDHDLEALRTASGLPAPGEAPRGVRRRETSERVTLSYAPSSLGLRIVGFASFTLMAIVFFFCSGGKLYIAAWPLLLELLLLGRSRLEITPEGIVISSSWLGLSVGRNFVSYDALTDISAAQGKEYPALRLSADGETRQLTAPSIEVARYLASCALYPPERARGTTGPYR